VGYALEHFNLSFASKAAALMNLRETEAIAPSGGKRDAHWALAYCIAKDARNYVVLGDPAASAATTQPTSGG
jgi:aryl-alcohol dehydrogenase-like predicted oxidoreductase